MNLRRMASICLKMKVRLITYATSQLTGEDSAFHHAALLCSARFIIDFV